MKNYQKIALVAESFISKILLDTACSLEIPLYSSIPLEKGVKTITRDKLFNLLDGADSKVIYTNAEDVLPLITDNTGNKELKATIKFFKDKKLLRELLQGVDPEIHFIELKREKLRDFVPQKDGPLIVKPSVGFLSLGIRRIDHPDQWNEKTTELLDELDRVEGMFHPSVLRSDRFLVEEYITGDEYACDGYFDANGNPVILGITRHLFRDEYDTRDVVYCTNEVLIGEHLPLVTELLHKICSKHPIRYFPFHLEFRIKRNHLHVIEINPMRFGGFGLADLSFSAFGVNPYEHYFKQSNPDWGEILAREQHKGKHYAFVLGRVPQEVKIGKPNHQAFKSTFSHILDYGIVDHTRYPCFCRVLAEGRSREEFEKYLLVDSGQFFKDIKMR